jgi:4-hydroxyphenylpyruvate dioxygenase
MSEPREAPGAIAVPAAREGIDPAGESNPAGIDGIEFIEYSTSRPQALGQVLERMGFRSIARHRSREVLLYRQGDMNIVVNAHNATKAVGDDLDTPAIAAVAFRFRDAAHAYRRALDRGAWPVSTHIEVMELNIPAVHGVGATRIYFVDRYREFSIYSVDFVPIPGVDQSPPPLAGLHWFGLVQYVGIGRLDDWTEFYHELFGFVPLPEDTRFGIMPKGRILKSPCGRVHLQLVPPDARVQALFGAERLERIGLGAGNVPAAVRALSDRGVEFYVSEHVHVEERGALTSPRLGGVMFELVRDQRPGQAAG